MPTRLLRAHVRRRTEDVPGERPEGGTRVQRNIRARFCLLNGLCQPEVQDLHPAFGRDLDVRWLDIAVDDALGVSGLERLCHLPRIIDRVVHRNRAAENRPLDELHDEVVEITRLLETVDGGNLRVVEGGQHPRLTAEACDTLAVPGEGVGQ